MCMIHSSFLTVWLFMPFMCSVIVTTKCDSVMYHSYVGSVMLKFIPVDHSMVDVLLMSC